MQVDDTLIESIAIVVAPVGYVAYLRFTDPKLDEDISADTYYQIHNKIDMIVRKKCSKQPDGSWRDKFKRSWQ